MLARIIDFSARNRLIMVLFIVAIVGGGLYAVYHTALDAIPDLSDVRTGRYAYVRDLTGPWLLYDDEKDPYQMHNLVKDAAAVDVQANLDALLQRRLKAAGDEFKPADYYLAKWGYKDRVDATGTLPTKP
jgi:hypothetical protein